MKLFSYFSLFFILSGCQMSEMLHINSDGSGTIKTTSLRDEQSYMKLTFGDYNNEEVFYDTTYVFKDFIVKHAATFDRISEADKAVLRKYKKVLVSIKKSSYDKVFQTTISQKFESASQIVDLYKTTEYASDIRNNYALSAEEHYYKVSYLFDGGTFERKVSVTDTLELKKQRTRLDTLAIKYGKLDLTQSYRLDYHFPRRIKSVSNSKVVFGEDRRSFILDFRISDCLKNPESTNLKVILE